jgi:cation diffusion facilitator CzcD-associated flavoprotein CzcO
VDLSPTPEAHVDVLIVGAGLSGIGAAVHLKKRCPDRSLLIIEGRADIGGTWDLFRYPGIRSDSDMHTLGFDFKPWTAEKAIADGASIMSYLRETVDEYDIGSLVTFSTEVRSASWSSEDAMWTVTAERSGTTVTYTASFLYMCSGYYRYDHGHQPDFADADTFAGQIVHPQDWPTDLDYAGKKVVVIGSGATAVTLVPALAETAGHVTMLQRSPTWVASRTDRDAIANALRRVLPGKLAYRMTRAKNTLFQQMLYKRSRSNPEKMREALLDRVRKELPDPSFDVDRHFNPSYDPWDQRLCLVTNGDLFTAMKEGRAAVVTDTIERFDAQGVVLTSGEHLDADIIVTATGLELLLLGGVAFDLDGTPVDFSKTWTYKGFAYSGVPNLISVFGYINASWTLRADLIAENVCRILNHLAETGTTTASPVQRPEDEHMTQRPWIDQFNPGYMARSMHLMPKQGDHDPWVNPHDYRHDRKMFLEAPLEDGVMTFAGKVAAQDATS